MPLMRSPITTHVLDTAKGCPAAGVRIELFAVVQNQRSKLGEGTTDTDGRVAAGLIESDQFRPGVYQLRFAVEDYFASAGVDSFFAEVSITFKVTADQTHYHVPLLLSPFGYTTYRGS